MPWPAAPAASRASVAGVTALVLLIALWELALAPLRPGGSWLVLKGLPLLVLLPGIARGNPRARTWMAMLLPWYVAEGLVRAMTEPGRHALVAAVAAALATATFGALYAWYRAERKPTVSVSE